MQPNIRIHAQFLSGYDDLGCRCPCGRRVLLIDCVWQLILVVSEAPDRVRNFQGGNQCAVESK